MISRAFLALMLLGLAACATPAVQSPMTPPAGFAGPRLEDDAFVSFDGARLGLNQWLPKEEPWAVIVGLHGMNEYAGRFSLAGPWFAERGVAVIAYDQRGYGRSPGRGVWPGEDLILKDIRTMTALARARYPNATIVVAGISMGGGAALTAFGSDVPPDADRLILLGPAVWGWKTQPLPNSTLLRIMGRTKPDLALDPPKFTAGLYKLSDNTEVLRQSREDPLITWGSRVDTVYGVVELMQKASDGVAKVKVPTLYLYGYQDVVIPRSATVKAARGLKPTDRSGYYRDGYHLLFIDQQRERVFADVLGFIRDPGAPLVSGVPPIPRR